MNRPTLKTIAIKFMIYILWGLLLPLLYIPAAKKLVLENNKKIKLSG